MLRSDLFDFYDAYIVVKPTINLTITDGRDFIDIQVFSIYKTMHHILIAYQRSIMY